MIAEIKEQVKIVLEELQEQAQLRPGQVMVIGCSTSEVVGEKIGTASNGEVADAIVQEILDFCKPHKIIPAFQSCEHLNRALVIEREAAEALDLDEVTVIPHPGAGGAASTSAMSNLKDPVVVEHLSAKARAGIDIGHTLIGMHIRPVVVPVRTTVKQVGKAPVVCARTRPKLIGGKRAFYPDK